MSGTVRQITVADAESGEIYSDVFTRGNPNGKGFVLMYTEKVVKLITTCPSATTLKVFMLLSMGQQYEEHGMVTTKKAVQDKLGITKPTCIEAFKWLKDNFIINECKVDGHTEFMVNPDYVTVGRDKKKRQAEWVRRWQCKTVQTLPASQPRRSIS